MVATRADSIPQGRKPGTFHQRSVSGELSASHAAGIKSLHVVWVRAQALLLQLLGPLQQVLDLLLGLGVGRTVRRGYKTVIGILTGVQRAHAIEFSEEHRSEPVIKGERIIRMPPQNLVNLLHGQVVIEVVEVTERDYV